MFFLLVIETTDSTMRLYQSHVPLSNLFRVIAVSGNILGIIRNSSGTSLGPRSDFRLRVIFLAELEKGNKGLLFFLGFLLGI